MNTSELPLNLACEDLARRARAAARALATAPGALKDRWLLSAADALSRRRPPRQR